MVLMAQYKDMDEQYIVGIAENRNGDVENIIKIPLVIMLWCCRSRPKVSSASVLYRVNRKHMKLIIL